MKVPHSFFLPSVFTVIVVIQIFVTMHMNHHYGNSLQNKEAKQGRHNGHYRREIGHVKHPRNYGHPQGVHKPQPFNNGYQPDHNTFTGDNGMFFGITNQSSDDVHLLRNELGFYPSNEFNVNDVASGPPRVVFNPPQHHFPPPMVFSQHLYPIPPQPFPYERMIPPTMISHSFPPMPHVIINNPNDLMFQSSMNPLIHQPYYGNGVPMPQNCFSVGHAPFHPQTPRPDVQQMHHSNFAGQRPQTLPTQTVPPNLSSETATASSVSTPQEEAKEQVQSTYGVSLLDSFLFTGLNFPVLEKRKVSSDEWSNYTNLLKSVENQIKQFFNNRLELWEKANNGFGFIVPSDTDKNQKGSLVSVSEELIKEDKMEIKETTKIDTISISDEKDVDKPWLSKRNSLEHSKCDLFELLHAAQNSMIVMFAEFNGNHPEVEESAEQQETATPETSNNEPTRFSRFSGFVNQVTGSNRVRSASAQESSRQTFLEDPCTSSNNSGSSPRPGSRRLPQLPHHIFDREFSSLGFQRSETNPFFPRRRHMSSDNISRPSWMNDNTRLSFIIPTETEFMARVPFPPYRIPLIGVARRDPGQAYVPQRILPTHENFASFRRRMMEMRANEDVGDPNHVRGSGPLLLEPRGFWSPRDGRVEPFDSQNFPLARNDDDGSDNEQGAETSNNQGT